MSKKVAPPIKKDTGYTLSLIDDRMVSAMSSKYNASDVEYQMLSNEFDY